MGEARLRKAREVIAFAKGVSFSLGDIVHLKGFECVGTVKDLYHCEVFVVFVDDIRSGWYQETQLVKHTR